MIEFITDELELRLSIKLIKIRYDTQFDRLINKSISVFYLLLIPVSFPNLISSFPTPSPRPFRKTLFSTQQNNLNNI